MLQDQSGHGDPDCVLGVPPQQYMPQYTFFADQTYPETNLVLVRAKANGAFKDVNLDCAGVLGGWQPVGDYEWTRVDLITGNFQNVGNCSTGRHSITSDAPFGLWVWGWGTPNTTIFTANVSYGNPGGMNVQPINEVVIGSEAHVPLFDLLAAVPAARSRGLGELDDVDHGCDETAACRRLQRSHHARAEAAGHPHHDARPSCVSSTPRSPPRGAVAHSHATAPP